MGREGEVWDFPPSFIWCVVLWSTTTTNQKQHLLLDCEIARVLECTSSGAVTTNREKAEYSGTCDSCISHWQEAEELSVSQLSAGTGVKVQTASL